MTRDALGDGAYWDKWFEYHVKAIDNFKELIKKPSGDPSYRPQFVYDIRNKYRDLMILRYSRGDAISELAQYFPLLMDKWDDAERLGKDVWSPDIQHSRHTWAVNKDFYMDSFWLIGLALALEIPDDQWQRLLALIGNEGQDVLLDRIISSRELGRKVGNKLLFPKPYRHLLAAVDTPKDKQAEKLLHFLNRWYPELNTGKSIYDQPYWYDLHVNLESGGYFGYWCIEAVAAVKAFGLDDRLCLGYPNYPGDLIRPHGSSTHPVRVEAEPRHAQQESSWFSRVFKK